MAHSHSVSTASADILRKDRGALALVTGKHVCILKRCMHLIEQHFTKSFHNAPYDKSRQVYLPPLDGALVRALDRIKDNSCAVCDQSWFYYNGYTVLGLELDQYVIYRLWVGPLDSMKFYLWPRRAA
jgi:hypothetical protein